MVIKEVILSFFGRGNLMLFVSSCSVSGSTWVYFYVLSYHDLLICLFVGPQLLNYFIVFISEV